MAHPVRLFESDLHTAGVHVLPASAAMAQSSVEKARSESEAKLLLAEVQHRMHNTLAVMRSLVRLTADTSKTVEHYAMHLEGRIDALARVQTAATRDPAGWVDLEMLVTEELHAYRAQEGEQVDRIHGPAIQLHSKAAEVFALAIHELATNAVKYGALSIPQGHVGISWRVNKAGGSRTSSLSGRKAECLVAWPGSDEDSALRGWSGRSPVNWGLRPSRSAIQEGCVG